MNVADLPMRVKNIFIWATVAFWASSRMTKALSSVLPLMKAGGNLNDPFLQMVCHSFVGQHVRQRIVQRLRKGQLFLEVAGEEAQVLTSLHSGTRHDDPPDPLFLQGLHSHAAV